MTETRCEPPPELRDRDGWHWVQFRQSAPRPEYWGAARNGLPDCWASVHLDTPMEAYATGYRYLAPATPPDVVARLVEALEAVLPDAECADDSSAEHVARLAAARAALAAYREAGR